MQEEIFYMALQVSKQFELEKEWLTIDNYYDAILEITNDYFKKEYHKKNMGLLESINNYINDNLFMIKDTLKNYCVSDTKNWN